MIKTIDRFLDHLTMYRLVLYYLMALVGTAFVLGFVKLVPHDPIALAFTTVLVLAACWITNKVFARVFEVPANNEFVYITALILALILDPVAATDLKGIGAVVFASVWAISSKFIFAIGRKHLFNPAALGRGAVRAAARPAGDLVGRGQSAAASRRACRRRAHRPQAAPASTLSRPSLSWLWRPFWQRPSRRSTGTALTETLGSSPLLFFAFVMLTEPLTAPTMRWPRIAFAAIVGFLFAPNIHIGSFYFTPELALLAGNFFAYAVRPEGTLRADTGAHRAIGRRQL